jgi:hypothetical protein
MKLRQLKFSLALIINILTAITFGYVCFLGANFYTLGDKEGSIILALIIILLLISTTIGAKLLKQTKRNFKSRFIMEVILLILFTVLLGYFTFFPFSHYFGVSENEIEIKKKLNTSMTQAENMFTKYENYVADDRKKPYESNLKSAVLTKNTNVADFKKYDFVENSISYDKQIENKMRTINFDLFPSNFEEMKIANTDWLAKSRISVNEWKPIGLIDVIKNVDQKSNSWKDQLINISKKRETGQTDLDTPNFEYTLTTSEVISFFTKLGKPTPLSFGLGILTYVLMLLSWISTKRDTKFPGLKIVFGNGKSTENEL